MSAESIAKALDGRSRGGRMARCEAHDNRELSLSVPAADEGKALVRCHDHRGRYPAQRRHHDEIHPAPRESNSTLGRRL
jgi:hypothetical protein